MRASSGVISEHIPENLNFSKDCHVYIRGKTSLLLPNPRKRSGNYPERRADYAAEMEFQIFGPNAAQWLAPPAGSFEEGPFHQ
jgi:hypothetical protein